MRLMRIRHRLVSGDDAEQQASEQRMRFQLTQEMLMPADTAVHLRDQNAADAQIGMSPAFADGVDLLDHTGQSDRLQVAWLDRHDSVRRGQQRHLGEQRERRPRVDDDGRVVRRDSFQRVGQPVRRTGHRHQLALGAFQHR